MSLTDLKKSKKAVTKKKAFTIDEFISDADNYAKGKPEIVSGDGKNPLSLTQAIILTQQHISQQGLTPENKAPERQAETKPFRHATFTLSEEAIEQLQLLANESQLAKSHIIRILIDELCNKKQHEQLKKLLSSGIN